ncbi:hypothetical protein Hanom_Chr10g00963231 [Helianthus anomalus]
MMNVMILIRIWSHVNMDINIEGQRVKGKRGSYARTRMHKVSKLPDSLFSSKRD